MVNIESFFHPLFLLKIPLFFLTISMEAVISSSEPTTPFPQPELSRNWRYRHLSQVRSKSPFRIWTQNLRDCQTILPQKLKSQSVKQGFSTVVWGKSTWGEREWHSGARKTRYGSWWKNIMATSGPRASLLEGLTGSLPFPFSSLFYPSIGKFHFLLKIAQISLWKESIISIYLFPTYADQEMNPMFIQIMNLILQVKIKNNSNKKNNSNSYYLIDPCHMVVF